jgi:hypothetical protein
MGPRLSTAIFRDATDDYLKQVGLCDREKLTPVYRAVRRGDEHDQDRMIWIKGRTCLPSFPTVHWPRI